MEPLSSRLWYKFNFAAVWATYTLAFSYRSAGSRHVPQTGPLLILSNHASYLDPLSVGLVVRRQVYYLARKSLFKGVFGTYLKSVGSLPVDIDGNATAGIRASLDILQSNRALVLFPEGTRSDDGAMVPFKAGVALLLRKAKVPVLPVGIAGAFENWPIHHKLPRIDPMFWPHHGGVGVCAGPVIQPSEYEGLERDALISLLTERIREQVENAKHLTRIRD